MDGLVLAAVLAAHCPFLVSLLYVLFLRDRASYISGQRKLSVLHSQVNSHLRNMFLHPTTAEQCLHNAVQVVEAFKMIHLDYDVVVRIKL